MSLDIERQATMFLLLCHYRVIVANGHMVIIKNEIDNVKEEKFHTTQWLVLIVEQKGTLGSERALCNWQN